MFFSGTRTATVMIVEIHASCVLVASVKRSTLSSVVVCITIGFMLAAFVSTWLEAIFLTAVGCVVGVTVAFLALDGMTASTTGSDQMQIGFEFALSSALVTQAVVLSLIIGAIGGGLPALNATRIPLRLAMTGRS